MITSANAPNAAPAEYMGLSTDTKPDNLGTNALFLELDTGDFYYFDGGAWKKLGTNTAEVQVLFDGITDDLNWSNDALAYVGDVQLAYNVIAGRTITMNIDNAFTVEAVAETTDHGTVGCAFAVPGTNGVAFETKSADVANVITLAIHMDYMTPDVPSRKLMMKLEQA